MILGGLGGLSDYNVLRLELASEYKCIILLFFYSPIRGSRVLVGLGTLRG